MLKGDEFAPAQRSSACNAILREMARAGKCRHVLKLVDVMRQSNTKVGCYSYNAILSVLGRVGRWADAIELLSRMEEADGVKPDKFMYNICISACGKSGRDPGAVEAAEGLLLKMERRSLSPTDVTFSALISVYGSAGRMEDALALLDEMKRRRLQPTQVTLGAAIAACAAVGNTDRAFAVLSKLEREEGLRPSSPIAFNSLIAACAGSGDVGRAMGVLQTMRAAGVEANTITYGALLNVCAKAKDWLCAELLLKDMERSGVRPNGIVLNTAIAAAHSADEPAAVIHLLGELQARGFSVNEATYSMALTSYVKLSRPSDAIKLMGTLKRMGLLTTTVNFNGAVTAAVDHSVGVSSLLAQMHKSVLPMNASVFSTAMQACATKGDASQALELLQLMVELNIRPNVMCYIHAIEACVAGSPAETMEESVLSLVDECWSRGLDPQAGFYILCIASCEGRPRLVLRILEDMRRRGVRVTHEHYTAAIHCWDRED